MPNKHKWWLGLIVLVAIGGFALQGFLASRAPDRAVVELQTMVSNQAPWLEGEKDLGTFVADLKRDEISLLGEATNAYLVTRSDGGKYVVFKSAAALTAVDGWVNRGGRLFVLNQTIDPTLSHASPVTRALTRILTPDLIVSLFALSLLALLLSRSMDLSSRFGVVSKPTLRFADVVGVSDAKRELGDLAAALRDRSAYRQVGAKPPRGVLLSGPPGTGKTLLAKALAGESGANFIAVDGSAFTDKFIGMGVARVRSLFRAARRHAPCVIFIDEIDGVGRRSSGEEAASQENNRIINALLTELDGFSSTDEVIVLAATNHPQHVDPALLREGRFDRKCMLALPALKEREALLALFSAKLTLAPGTDVSVLARRTAGMAPAAIEAVVAAAARLAAREAAPNVTQSHFLGALSQQQLGSPTPETKMSEAERERTAYHEAGHALIGRLLNVGTVEKVTILPHSNALGVTLLTAEEDRHLHTERELEARVQMLLGGRAAELVVYDMASTGASNDLERASSIVYRMVAEFGFSSEHGPFSVAGLAQQLPDAAAQAVAEARRLLKALEAKCVAHLESQRSVLEALAQALLAHETLEGKELDDILEQGARQAA